PGTELVAALTLKQVGSIGAEEMSRPKAQEQLNDGDVQGIVYLGYAAQAGAAPPKMEVELVLEGTNPQDSGAIARSVNRGLMQVVVKELGRALGMADVSPQDLVDVEVSFVYGGPQFDFVDYEAPALIAFFAFFFVFLLTAVSFLRERAGGTLERLMATPINRTEVVLGYMLGFGFFALLQSLAILLAAVLILRIHYEGNLLLVFLLVAILTMGSVNLGIFLSTFARNELQVIQFVPVVVVPQGLLSGVIWSVDSLPGWLQVVSHLLPLTYAIDALRNTMIKGQGLADSGVLPNALVMVGFAAFFVLLASRTVRQQVE
ncbi:MAG: ABC transporter permease, partial [Chloroflexota bacterium]|nr:ABC transporter permease [Chloroflexota bacterium]